MPYTRIGTGTCRRGQCLWRILEYAKTARDVKITEKIATFNNISGENTYPSEESSKKERIRSEPLVRGLTWAKTTRALNPLSANTEITDNG